MSDFRDLLAVGGATCLDLANTVDWRFTERAVDRLGCYEDLLTWADQLGALQPALAAQLGGRALADRSAAAGALERAKQLREAIYAIFSPSSAPAGPSSSGWEAFNEVARPLLGATKLDDGELAWAGPEEDLERPLWAAAWSAVDLLRGPLRNQVGQCASPECRWLFLDLSRNHSRRWCAMSNCGTREKNRRYYRSHREAKGTSCPGPSPAR